MYKIPLYFLKEMLSLVKSVEKALSGDISEASKKKLLNRLSNVRTTLERITGNGTNS